MIVRVGPLAYGLSLGAALTLPARQAAAHARWFIDETKIPEAAYAFDQIYAAIFAGAAFFVLGAIALEHAATRNSRVQAFLFARLPVPFDLDWRVLSSCLGVVLVATNFTAMVLAPNLKADQTITTQAILAAEAVVGALFLLQTRLRIAAALTIALPVGSLLAFTPLKVVDYAFEFIGLGLAFWIIAPQLSASPHSASPARPSRLKRTREPLWPVSLSHVTKRIAQALDGARFKDATAGREAASALRTFLGIQLIILAAHDKIFEPGVSLAFVEKNPFVNIPALLGATGFTNLHFVFGAGMAEIVFGLLLITNTCARLVAAMLAGLFTLTGLVFGLHEMLGHMPILFSFLVLVTQGGTPDSALAVARSRASPALGTALAAILLGITGIAFEPKSMEARAATLDLAPIASSASGFSVPAALYERFTALANPKALEGETVQNLNAAIKTMFETSSGEQRRDKDDLSSKLADLAIRYEMAAGADAASRWLRFAVLTAACSQNEIRAFQQRVTSGEWPNAVDAAPSDLTAVLLPIASAAAAKIMKTGRMDGPLPWTLLAERAPTSGPDYAYTHTLACIVRILAAASEMQTPEAMRTTALP